MNKILILSPTNQKPHSRKDFFEAELIIQLLMDGTFVIVKNRHSKNGLVGTYNEILNLEQINDNPTNPAIS